jgi:hypothetical protein
MVKPISVFTYFALKPLRKLPQMNNELSVEILNATLNIALVLRIRRMRKMSLNTTVVAPPFPLHPKLRPTITQNSLGKPPLPLQHCNRFSRGRIMIKLLNANNEAAVITYTHQKPPPFALHAERPFKLYLPKLIRRRSPKEVPALILS